MLVALPVTTTIHGEANTIRPIYPTSPGLRNRRRTPIFCPSYILPDPHVRSLPSPSLEIPIPPAPQTSAKLLGVSLRSYDEGMLPWDQFPVLFEPVRIERLGGHGGFSGAALHRLTSAAGQFCLRRWPPDIDRQRVTWIHDRILHLAQQGIDFVPVPVLARDRTTTFVDAEGAIWELAPWLPGEANYLAAPSDTRLRAATAALARLHVALASDALVTHEGRGPSPGLAERLESVARLLGGQAEEIARAVRRAERERPPAIPAGEVAAWSRRAEQLLSLFGLVAPGVLTILTPATCFPLPLQACLRDIWHDHLLFVGDRVSGIVDFGAMRVDTVATDLARLLGSLCGDDRQAWQKALDEYASHRPLSLDERAMINVFDRSSVLLAGMNWLRWLFVERRWFEDPRRVASRLDAILVRLRCLAE